MSRCAFHVGLVDGTKVPANYVATEECRKIVNDGEMPRVSDEFLGYLTLRFP